MFPTDTLTCQVTPDSVEPTSLSCSVPPLEWLDLWTTIGGVTTAAFTLVLAIFAVAAWRSSQKQLRQMEGEGIAAEKRFAKQLLENRNGELRKAAEESLFDYMSAHADIVAASTGEGMPVGIAQTQVKKANLRFRMVWALPGMGGELTNFDTIMTMLASRRLEELENPDWYPHPYGAAEAALLQGFQSLSMHVSNLFSKRIDPLQFREALAAEHRYILRLHEDLLEPRYVRKMIDLGMV